VIETETNNVMRGNQKDGTANVLIVDSDTEQIRLVLQTLARKGIRANLAGDKKAAADFLDSNDCDLVFTSADIDRPRDGFELLQEVRANLPELPVIMMWSPLCGTSRNGRPVKGEEAKEQDQHQIVETAVRAIRAGCCDFLVKPLDCEKIETLLDTFLPNYGVSTVATAQEGSRWLYRIVGRSPKLIQTVKLAQRVAPTSAPVLVSGESGTGKELISFLIHQKSRRALGAYVKVNCAALSDSLLESELFGHEKGAFTGAYTQRKGRFELASGGTLLLDEITETPIRFQAKLLRLIEEQEFERVGGNENIRVNVRIISTTNKDLLEEVRWGRFRQDLYYRLSGVRLVVSPLRERLDDLPELVWHFVNLYAREANRRITMLDPAMMDIFAKYDWPGNVRQLRNVVVTSLILGVGPVLSLADVSWLFDELQPLPQRDSSWVRRDESCAQQTPHDLHNTQHQGDLGGIPLEQLERRAILDTLRQTAGNQAKAAKVLGISDRTLRDKVRRYRQDSPRVTSQRGCLPLPL
jgi:DNA-binding NtrC family response regulator